MERPLVILNGADRERDIVNRALTLANATGSPVEFLAVFSPDEVEEQQETLESIGDVEGTTYESDTARGSAQQSINRALEATGVSVEYELSVVIEGQTDHADAIIDTCEQRDCDHVFIAGRKRSPAGKAVFGDVVQNVLLNAAVPVTTYLGS